LDKLIAQHEMCKDVPKKDQPRNILEKVETCVKFFRPLITSEELGLILKERAGLRPSTRSSTLLTRENLQMVDGCLEELDRKEAAEHASRVSGGGAAKQAAIKFMVARGYLKPDQLVWELGRVVGLRAAAAQAGATSGKSKPRKGEWSWEEKALKALVPPGVPPQGLYESGQGGQGRAEFVAGIGQEVGPHALDPPDVCLVMQHHQGQPPPIDPNP
jgi:hypothetical protein